jgi:hypothetical protein
MPLGKDEIEHRFGSHPATPITGRMHEQVRDAYVAFAEFLDRVLPDGRAKSTAFTNLQQSSMWANYGVAELAPVEWPKPVTAKPTAPSKS